MRDAVRVALLARPGAGADRLREALGSAGAELVLEADPTTLEPATLAGARAETVVVVLDAAVEEALDRLDPVLHDPAIDVLYEESEVAAAREGWDVARWSRHLSAKLLRHDDVLPPGREADGDVAPRPAARTAAAPASVPAPAPAQAPSMFDPVAAEFDPGQDEAAPLELSLTDDAPPAAPEEEAPVRASPERPEAAREAAEPAAEPDWSSLTLALEDDASTDGAARDAPQPERAPDVASALSLDDDAPPADLPPTVVASTPAPVAPVSAPSPAPAQAPRGDAIRDFRRDLAGIEQRIASMGLVADDPPPAAPEEPATAGPVEADDVSLPAGPTAPSPAAPGAVLVFAGIGGPDAVRQFLGALPDAFPRPVLIHQRLDGGRHDRLVQQMARATSLPVHLAAEDEAATPGHVYILPPGLGLSDPESGLRFAATTDPMATLPSAGSAVLMFSGSDTALVEAAMGHAQAGAMVAGQSPEDCYDAAAADALVARGAESGAPAELARRLVERWAA